MSPVRRATAEPFLDVGAVHGEGPIWDAVADRLLWVDMHGQRTHRTTAAGVDEVTPYAMRTASIAPRAQGGYVIGLADGLYLDDPNGALEPLFHVADVTATPLNDGKCDPWGRYWIGSTAADGVSPVAALYRVDPDRSSRTVLRGVTISNGMAWAADRRTMYYIDTGGQAIDAFTMVDGELDPTTRRTAAVIPAGPGRPDGMTIDDDGCLWVALWRGGAVHRYTPEGVLDTVLSLPVPQVTSCAFGGADGGDLFITTSTLGAPTGAPSTDPAGAVYRWRPGVTGPPAYPFGG